MLVSSLFNFCPDKRGGGEGGHFFRLSCSVVLWGWGNTANKYHWHVWGVLAVFQPHGVCPHSWPVCFPGLHCSDSRLLCQELSEVGPGLHAFPRSKPLRFRFSSTPQRCRLGWGCVLCPSQVRAAQVTRCMVCTVVPRWVVCLIVSSVPGAQFSECTTWCAFSGVPCVPSGELVSGCNPPSVCQLSRILRTLG